MSRLPVLGFCIVALIALGASFAVLRIRTAELPALKIAQIPAEPVAEEKRPLLLTAVGDVMLSRKVGHRISKYGVDFPFARTIDLLRGGDIAYANLETPVAGKGYGKLTTMNFRTDPAALKGLATAGFGVVSVANNHAFDFGRSALADTMKNLTDAKIAYTGAGKDLATARKPTVVEANGYRVAFLSYCDILSPAFYAKKNIVTIAPVDSKTLPLDIAEAKKGADLVVVCFHWGSEYVLHPSKRQKDLGHLAIDSGADLVIGHHPHVLEDVESYKGRMILYSLGNFVFDQREKYPERNESAIMRIEVTPGKSSLKEVIPVQIIDSQPRKASDAAGARIFARLGVKEPVRSPE